MFLINLIGSVMKIIDDIYVVGGGEYGIGLSSNLDCNMFVIDGGKEAALIDCGVGFKSEIILDNISKEKLNLKKIKKIFLTHAHLDHSGGAFFFKEKFGAEIYMSEKEAAFLEEGNEEAIGLKVAKEINLYPSYYSFIPAKVEIPLNGWEIIQIGRYKLHAIPTPGHSMGSFCFFLTGHEKKILFSGDTVFQRGLISLQNLPDCSLVDYKVGISNLKDLEVDCLLPGHYGFTLGMGQLHINMALNALNGLSIPRFI